MMIILHLKRYAHSVSISEKICINCTVFHRQGALSSLFWLGVLGSSQHDEPVRSLTKTYYLRPNDSKSMSGSTWEAPQ